LGFELADSGHAVARSHREFQRELQLQAESLSVEL